MFTNACAAIIVVTPSATSDPNRSSRLGGDAACPRHAITQKQSSDGGGADQAELLADHGVDEVGVRLGQIEQLLDAFDESAPEDAAGADGDERLDDLEALAVRVRPRVEKREQTVDAGTARTSAPRATTVSRARPPPRM